jgi:dTMP kinase
MQHRPDTSLGLTRAETRASYIRLLREHKWLRRFFAAQGLSALGDWIGMIALLALVARITEDEFAVAGMLFARFLPALLFGPFAGVFLDRWDRKRVMVFCDLARGALIATLPFIEALSQRVPLFGPLALFFLISAIFEMLTILWAGAKDSSVPDMVRGPQLTRANSLMLIAAYGTFPLAGAAFGFLVPASKWLGKTFEFLNFLRLSEENLAFYFDTITFMLSAALTSTLVIGGRYRPKKRLDFASVRSDFLEGMRSAWKDERIRPWLIGIGMIFVGVGTLLVNAFFYVTDVLGGTSAGTGLLITFVGSGLGLGFIFAHSVTRLMPRDVFFSVSTFFMGAALIGFASFSTLPPALATGFILGLFAGFAYPTGLTLVQEHADQQVRGRVISTMHMMVRLALVGSAAGAPIVARIVGDASLNLFGRTLDLRGIRVVMWLGGLSILAAAAVTARSVVARLKWATASFPGLFFVFEGGEGAGKTTQIQRLARYLESEGRSALVTREPGGTEAGARIREVLLSPRSRLEPQTEALLYAADRAQHVSEVIRPALRNGAVVISDRYLDSSLAYQGAARGLGEEQIMDLNRWATGGLMPDLVFLLDLDPKHGLERSGIPDRIEQEELRFHYQVRGAYRDLAARLPDRFVLIDASRSPEWIEEQIRRSVSPFLERAAKARVGPSEDPASIGQTAHAEHLESEHK